MKKITGLILCICLLLTSLLTGCGPKAGPPASDPSSTNDTGHEDEEKGNISVDLKEQYIDFAVQYIRTDGYIDGEKYPKTSWITSVSELEEYYNANKDKYYLESVEHPYSDQTIGYQDAVKNYDDAFFEKNDLLFVVLEEGSGSIRHEVTGVKVLPAKDNHYALQPEIDRITPECGTDDMAEWHIMIEIGKEYGKSGAESVTPVITARMLTDSNTESEPSADTASVAGPYGQISVYIPATWTAEAAPMDSDKLMYGLYGLILKPRDAASGQIELFCSDSFGVCGTGLSTEEKSLAGGTAHIGTYDNHTHWDFITFRSEQPQIVAQHTDCSSWTEAMWDEAMAVLDTMKFNESITEGGVGQFIRESENDTIAVIMEVRNVSASGLTVHFQQYDKRDTTELIYGEGYMLKMLEGGDWVDVPQIIDNAVFTDIGFSIPAEGEAEIETNWEWLYGKLTPGTYRISKTVWARTGSGSPATAYPLIAQFIIAGS